MNHKLSGIPNHIFFIGIGGIGTSSIAKLLLDSGYSVFGSDVKENETVKWLRSMGANITIGHTSLSITNQIGAVVVSSAISPDNIELKKATEIGIPILHRSEMLAWIVKENKVVAVAGSHGKTTTTSLIASILEEAQLDPTISIGGVWGNISGNSKLGKGDYAVIEADESDGSFLNYSPSIAVITNIEFEHADHYENLEELMKHFLSFANNVTLEGTVVICEDDENNLLLKKHANRKTLSYGIKGKGDIVAKNICYKRGATYFDVFRKGEKLGESSIQKVGAHNVSNALAAICVALEIGVDFHTISRGLRNCQGVDRRMQLMSKGKMVFNMRSVEGLTIIQDYGHHPTEISSTINALKEAYDKRIVTIFQPHRYSRTKTFLSEFSTALSKSDYLLITDIYPASEKPIKGFSIRNLLKELDANNYHSYTYFVDYQELKSELTSVLKNDDLILILGAGDIDTICNNLCQEIIVDKVESNK